MYGADTPDEDREDRDVFYYITLYNENYVMPPVAADPAIADGIVRGLYRWAPGPPELARRATILFSGSAQGVAREAAADLAEHYGVSVELWSATSYKCLREEALAVERWNRLHPHEARRTPVVTQLLEGSAGPITAVTDFMKAVPDQIARFVPRDRPFNTLGTDGMGRSDTREALRRHFEIDAGHVVVGTLTGLMEAGEVDAAAVSDAITRYDIDPEAVDPIMA
jgi:pyruvate dehydrogenase E1 component